MDITLKHLKALIALKAEGNFGRAADGLNLTQPALSMQIRDLESRLGAQLVERNPRGAVLTPVGRDVHARAERIFDELREISQLVRWQGGLAGRLRLGLIPTVAPYLLPAALPVIRARDIAMDLGIREAQTGMLLRELATGTLDAAVVALPAETGDFVVEPLCRDRFMLAANDAAMARLDLGRADLRPEQMIPDQLLLLDEGHCLTDQALAVCALKAADARMDLRAASLSTLCRLVAQGFGLTLVPGIAAAAERAATPGLRLLRFTEPEPARDLVLLRRARSSGDGWFAELATILRDAAGQAGAEPYPPCTGRKPDCSALPLTNPGKGL